MSLELLIQIGTLVSVIVGIITLYIALRGYLRQMNSQIFIEYTSRFGQIMNSFPRSAWASRLDLSREPPAPTEELSLCVLKYLNLCAEEYYLYKRGYLAKEVWTIWECELRRTLQSSLFRREWKELVNEFESYPEFRDFVQEIQAQEVPKPLPNKSLQRRPRSESRMVSFIVRRGPAELGR